MDADAARSRARIGFMRRSAAASSGVTIEPRRAVTHASPVDASTSQEQGQDQQPKRKQRKPKAPTHAPSPAAASPDVRRSAQKRERIPADLASRRTFFATRVGRYCKLSDEPAIGLYEDVTV